MTDNTSPPDSPPDCVTCPATSEPAVRWFIGAGMLLAIGVWCFVDRHNYPAPESWTLQHISEASGYLLNHFAPMLLVPAGVLLAWLGWRAKRRVLVADGQGIGYVGKAKVAWSDVQGLDASRLKDEQILGLKLKDGGLMKLDAWKLRNFRDLVAFVETRVPRQ